MTRGELLVAMSRERSAFWGWDREQWIRTVAACDVDVRQLVIAVAFGCCGFNDLHWGIRGFKATLFAGRVFSPEPVTAAVAQVSAHLDQLGQAAQLGRPGLQRALLELMFAARSPLLSDLVGRPDLLVQLHGREQNNARRYGVEQLARTMAQMGLLDASPFTAAPSREEWLARSRAGEHEVPEVWLDWAQRWFRTCTLSPTSRHGTYFALIKCGRWLGTERSEHADPRSWTRETAAAWVARVDQMLVGEFSKAPNTDYMRRRSGGELRPRTKASLIWALRRFFFDLQEWEWIERRFDPRRALALPRTIGHAIGPDPRVISEEIWAKLMWAGLNLSAEDLPAHGLRPGTRQGKAPTPWYPLELVRAVALLWLFAGLRTDEILRLRVGATRWQRNNDSDGEHGARVCLLDVPTNKTSTAFTKPVDPLVGDAIERMGGHPSCPAAPGGPQDRQPGRLLVLLSRRPAVLQVHQPGPDPDAVQEGRRAAPRRPRSDHQPSRPGDDRDPALQRQGPNDPVRASGLARAQLPGIDPALRADHSAHLDQGLHRRRLLRPQRPHDRGAARP